MSDVAVMNGRLFRQLEHERDQTRKELEDSLTRLHWFFEQFRERRHHPYADYCDCMCCATERLLVKHGKLGG